MYCLVARGWITADANKHMAQIAVDTWTHIISFIGVEDLYRLRVSSQSLMRNVDTYATPSIEIYNMDQYHKIPFKKCNLIIIKHPWYIPQDGEYFFTNADLLVLSRSLTQLDLSWDNIVTDDTLSQLTNLRSLNLSNNRKITGAGVVSLTNLTKLDVGFPNALTDSDFQFPLLTTLKIHCNKKLTDAVCAACPNLTDLDVYSNKCITDAGLAHLPNLTRLSLWNDTRITDEGLANVPRLRALDLTGTNRVIGHGLAHLPNLTQLRISSNSSIRCVRLAAPANLTSLTIQPIDDFDVPAFLCTLTNLTELDVGPSGSSLLTDALLEHLSGRTTLMCFGYLTNHQKALLTRTTSSSVPYTNIYRVRHPRLVSMT